MIRKYFRKNSEILIENFDNMLSQIDRENPETTLSPELRSETTDRKFFIKGEEVTREQYFIDQHKQFSSWNVKHEMLVHAKNALKRLFGTNNVNPLLDLACGPITDLNHWSQCSIKKVIGIDFSKEQIEEGRKRYDNKLLEQEQSKNKTASKTNSNKSNKSSRSRASMPKVELHIGSVTDEEFVKSILKNNKVNLVTCNYAINQMNLHDLFKTLHSVINDKGLFIGTATDGDTISQIFEVIGPNTKAPFYEIEKKSPSTYSFFMKTRYFEEHKKIAEETITENIVIPSELVEIAKLYDFHPYAIQYKVPPICNLSKLPVMPRYAERPTDLSGIYFAFSFIKLKIPEPNPLLIIPYRDDVDHNRSKQLKILLKELPRDIPVCVVEQTFKKIDKEEDLKFNKFNRGYLINVACALQRDQKNYFIIHDVDLVPDKDLIKYYKIFPVNPIHLGHSGQRYSDKDRPGKDFLGGVLSISKDEYFEINGFPNNFWGWGGEDDVFGNRMRYKDIIYTIPENGSVKDLEPYSTWAAKKIALGENRMDKDLRHKLENDDREQMVKNGGVSPNGVSKLTRIDERIKSKEYKNIGGRDVFWIKT